MASLQHSSSSSHCSTIAWWSWCLDCTVELHYQIDDILPYCRSFGASCWMEFPRDYEVNFPFLLQAVFSTSSSALNIRSSKVVPPLPLALSCFFSNCISPLYSRQIPSVCLLPFCPRLYAWWLSLSWVLPSVRWLFLLQSAPMATFLSSSWKSLKLPWPEHCASLLLRGSVVVVGMMLFYYINWWACGPARWQMYEWQYIGPHR